MQLSLFLSFQREQNRTEREKERETRTWDAVSYAVQVLGEMNQMIKRESYGSLYTTITTIQHLSLSISSHHPFWVSVVSLSQLLLLSLFSNINITYMFVLLFFLLIFYYYFLNLCILFYFI